MNSCDKESELLLLVGRKNLTDTQSERLRELTGSKLNWDLISSTATAHGLMPLLHKHRSHIQAPDSFIYTLTQEFVFNTESNLYLTSVLIKLIRAFRDHGIRYLVFKGITLSLLAYGDLSLRQAGDIDILIEKEDLSRVIRLLEKHGFQMQPPLTNSQQAAHLSSHCEIEFARDNGFTVVDLHWGLAPKSFVFAVATEELFDRAQCVDVNGETVKTFGTEDMVLFQCMHGGKHGWRRAEGVCSLAELIRQNTELDWEQIISDASTTHALRRLALGLRMVDELTDAPVPQHILERIDPSGSMKQLSEQISRNIWRTQTSKPGAFQTFKYEWKIMDKRRHAIASRVHAALVPTLSDWQTLNLPGWLYPVYYLYRPLRLLRVYLGEVLKTGVASRETASLSH